MHTGDRSADAIDAGGVLPGYQGVIVRDGYAGYGHLTDALHAWCGFITPTLRLCRYWTGWCRRAGGGGPAGSAELGWLPGEAVLFRHRRGQPTWKFSLGSAFR